MTLNERLTKVDPGSGDDPVYVEARAWEYESLQLSCVALHVDTHDGIVDFTSAKARALGLQLIAAADLVDHAIGYRVLGAA